MGLQWKTRWEMARQLGVELGIGGAVVRHLFDPSNQ